MWLSRRTVKVLKRIRIQQAELRLKLGGEYRDHALVFTVPDGGPIDPNDLRKPFKKIARQARLPDCRFHDLRHTHASLMLEQGVHPKIVQERLGHSTVTLTLDTYSHVVPSLQEAVAARIDGWLTDGESGEEMPA